VPASACFRTKAICACETFDLFIVHSASRPSNNWNFPDQSGPGNRQQVRLIRGGKVVAMSASRATIRMPSGSELVFLRQPRSGATPLWTGGHFEK